MNKNLTALELEALAALKPESDNLIVREAALDGGYQLRLVKEGAQSYFVGLYEPVSKQYSNRQWFRSEEAAVGTFTMRANAQCEVCDGD